MTNVIQVAEYILSAKGYITPMKLQKLVYYSQAWHLAWTEQPLFSEKIEAWRDGPVAPKLFELHKGHFKMEPGFFAKKARRRSVTQLSADEKDVIDRVLAYYGERDPHWLSQLTHLEPPWKQARKRAGIIDGENSSEEISHQSMFEYYSALCCE